jgi:8-oxo-dGTP pyrophosphatase MutT (NUDIX family)
VSSYFYNDRNAPRPNRARPVTVVALIEHGGRVLFDRRADAPYWGLIAGTVEPDETLEQALRREVGEETGLTVAQLALFGTFSHPSRIVAYADGAVVQPVTLAYEVVVDDVRPLRLSDESRAFAWFAPAEIPVGDVIATHRPILNRYLSGDRPPFLD